MIRIRAPLRNAARNWTRLDALSSRLRRNGGVVAIGHALDAHTRSFSLLLQAQTSGGHGAASSVCSARRWLCSDVTTESEGSTITASDTELPIVPGEPADTAAAGHELQEGKKRPLRLADLPQELIDKYIHKLGSWRTTFRSPVYALPLLEAKDEEIEKVDADMVRVVAKLYGARLWVPMKGYIKPHSKESRIRKNSDNLTQQKADWPTIWRHRLRACTKIPNKQVMKRGTVISNKMETTVRVAVRVKKYAPKFNKHFFMHHNFFAHDELNLCREGDEVAIKKLSTGKIGDRKAFVVVENYGNRTYKNDPRKAILDELIEQRHAIEVRERTERRKIRPLPRSTRKQQLERELSAQMATATS